MRLCMVASCMPVFTLRCNLNWLWLLILLCSIGSHAAAANQITLINLQTGHVWQLSEQQPTLLIFFAPECLWCDKQIAELSTLTQICATINPVLVGVNGSAAALRRQWQHFSTPYPAFMPDRKTRVMLGGLNTTPIIILAIGQQLIAGHRGYIAPTELTNWLNQHYQCS